jgi:predicted PurR-regulated permease PerM
MAGPDDVRNVKERDFVRRVLIVIAITGGAIILWELRYVLVLLFGAVLVATVIRAIADPIRTYLRLPERLSVLLSVILIVFVVAGTAWLIGAQIASQSQLISDSLPRAVRMVDGWLDRIGLDHPVQHWVSSLHARNGVILSDFGGWISSLSLGVASVLIVVFGGIFLAASPRLYRIGTVKLVPEEKRGLIAEAMQESATALRLWLKGQLWAMIIIGLMTWAGLMLLGVPSALVLAIISGVLEFVPYAGAIASSVPAIMVALVQGPELALWTAAMYVIVHHAEAYVIQPIVQQYAVEIPAVIMLFSLLAFGMLFGFIGVLFAAPMAVVIYVMIKRLYVVEALHTATPIPGEDKG